MTNLLTNMIDYWVRCVSFTWDILCFKCTLIPTFQSTLNLIYWCFCQVILWKQRKLYCGFLQLNETLCVSDQQINSSRKVQSGRYHKGFLLFSLEISFQKRRWEGTEINSTFRTFRRTLLSINLTAAECVRFMPQCQTHKVRPGDISVPPPAQHKSELHGIEVCEANSGRLFLCYNIERNTQFECQINIK